jgi:hypothetical protein
LATITVAVAETRKDFLTERIVEAVQRDSNLSLYGERALASSRIWDSLNLGQRAPDAIILVGVGNELTELSSALLQRYPSIIVARVEIAANTVQFDAKYDVGEPGLDELISAVRKLVNVHGTAPQDRLVSYVIPQQHVATQKSSPSLRIGSLVDYVLAWIDALLLDHIKRGKLRTEDLPGLTISQATAENIVSGETKSTDSGTTVSRESIETAYEQLEHALSNADPDQEPLAALRTRLSLSRLETKAFLLCLAPDLDAKYQRVYGFIHDDLGRRSASFGLICALLGEPVIARSSLATTNNLLRWRLLTTETTVCTSAEELLRIDPSIVAWILGNNDALHADRVIRSAVLTHNWPGAAWLEPSTYDSITRNLAGFIGNDIKKRVCIALAGDQSSWWRAILESAAQQVSSPLIRVSVAALVESEAADLEDAVVRISRSARLRDGILVLDVASNIGLDRVRRVVGEVLRQLDQFKRPCIVIAEQTEHIVSALSNGTVNVIRLTRPALTSRVSAIIAAAADTGFALEDETVVTLASSYALSLDQVDEAFRIVAADGGTLNPTDPQLSRTLFKAFRAVACPDLPKFARRLDSQFELKDVILPLEHHSQLQEVVNNVRNASKVLDSWGFAPQLPYGRGVSALFSGPSGTGKTMAAQAIAHALQTDIFSVDLSRIVSKYIGETEKNLDAVFVEAERAYAILCFDEADALFGKRSETKDAHDRYANIEVAYLLQRMEEFSGLAILTTNFKQNLDQAFLRRLRFVVEFPKPDAKAREALWRQCLPPTAPQAKDIDFRFLARRLEITGGNIRQITLRAAFAAANEDSPIGMRHLVDATRAELAKLGLQSIERELAERAA